MIKLSKEEQMKLMFMWNEDPALELIYKDFNSFVYVRTGYKKETDHAKAG